MIRRFFLASLLAVAACSMFSTTSVAQERAYGRAWGRGYTQRDWERFYHYPYVFYPHNFWGSEYYRSSEDMYHRYPPEMRVPVYNNRWHNFYPQGQRYHWGNHFILDVF